MIVPSSRLIFWFALVVVPCAALGATLPEFRPAAFAGIGMLLAVIGFDAMRARRALAGIRVELPELVRLQKDRSGEIELRIENTTKSARALRLGFAFPAEVATAQDDLLVALPAETTTSRFTWTCTPLKRGQYFLDRGYLEAASPLGFWACRGSTPTRGELRVYPNLFDERKNVAALFLNRGGLGAHVQRQSGKGREFEKLREYVHGDASEDIHWKASAKRGQPVTKVFQVERTQEVYVIIDASRLSAREVGIQDETKTTTVLERFVTSAMIFAMAAQRQGDAYGLMIFSDKVRAFVRAKNGRAHYDSCREAIYAAQPQIVSPDFEEACSFIRLRLRKRALLIFLTALDDPALAESFVRSVDLIRRQHLVLVNMFAPPGTQPLFSNGDVKIADDIYAKLGGHLRWNNLRELEKVLSRSGVRLNLAENEKLSVEMITQYLNIKARQLI